MMKRNGSSPVVRNWKVVATGIVRQVREVDLNPLLVQACQDSVKEWKFFASPEETTQIVECDFHGGN